MRESHKMPASNSASYQKSNLLRHKMERKLKESKGRLRQFFENEPEYCYKISPEGVILDANRSALKVLGYKKNELVGKPLQTIYAPESRQKMKRYFAEWKKTGRLRNKEMVIISKDGSRRTVLLNADAVKDENGKILHSVSVQIDVTERKQTEERLRDTEWKYRNLVELAPDGIITTNLKGMITSCNTAFLNLSGYSKDEIVNKHFSKLPTMRAKDIPKYIKIFNSLIRRKTPKPFEAVWAHKNGTTYVGKVQVGPLRKGRKTIGFQCIIRDITEHKKAEEEKRTLREEYVDITNLSGDIVVKIDKEGRWTFLNDSACKFWGKPKDKLLGAKYTDYLHPDDAEKANACVQELIKTKKIVRGVVNRQNTPQGWRMVEWNGTLIFDKAGNYAGMQATGRDITERRKIEEKLISSREELRSLYRHLQSIKEKESKRIAREIHDELAQALTALKIDLSWLPRRLSDNHKDQKQILEKTKSMSRLIDSTIQTVQRISAELRPRLLDDLGLLPAIEWQVENFETRTEIKCTADLDCNGVDLDPDRSTAIFRIFQEALTNVARHAVANRVKISLKKKNSKLEMKIRDNGKGIRESDIFSPNSLGIIGMRERLRPFGGKLKINGVPNKGTTLSIALPIDKSQIKGVI